jgi:diguanylate cyclase (GGDEF)-like protein/PAS domain S-box-containing protein
VLTGRRTDVYRELFLRQPQPMWIFDPATLAILEVNDAACTAYGYTRSAMQRLSTEELRPVADVASYRIAVRNFMAEEPKTATSDLWRHRRADGSVFYADVFASVIDYNGRPACLVLAIDATARIAVSRALTESRAALTEAQELAHLGSFDTDFWTGELRWSSELYRLLGVDSGSERPTLLSEFDHPDDAATVRAELARARAERQPYAVEHRIVTRDGRIRHVFESGRFHFEEGTARPRRVIGVMLDITDRKIAEERLRHLAEHDALTQLPNRTLSSTRLIAAIERASRATHQVGVFFIYVDRFKAVNDSMEHTAGDRLLRELALRLRDSVGAHGIVGRPGGDEFIVVIDKIEHEDEAVRVGHDLLETVARPFHYGEHRIEVSASIGLALYPRDGSTPDELLSSADTAMYAAKSRGGNALESYAPQLRRVTLEQIELERALRGALDRGAVDVAYQPIVDAKTGKIVSFEALVRWTENGEIIEPSRFVPLAESTGLIVRLGTFVLQRACAQARLWLDDHPDLRICINISAHQFRDPAFLDCVRTTLEETGVPPDRLNLEITESAYMGADVGVSNVRNLEALGIGMSIDDFGTGYSSLGYLKRLPVDALKIDRSFISDIVSDPADQAIVRAIIAVAQNLGLTVIAEGVETFEQAEYLVALGCTCLQGFYFARPLTADVATYYLESAATPR